MSQTDLINKENELYKKMSFTAQIGWWEADFVEGNYVCSDFLIDLFGLKTDRLPFAEFRNIIREDYREQVLQEFREDIHKEFYERTFPVYSRSGIIWVHSRVAGNQEDPVSGKRIRSFGTFQVVQAPDTEAEQLTRRINDFLHRQNAISQSLQTFLRGESIELCVNEVLKNLLKLYGKGRVYIIEYTDNGTSSCTYEVSSEEKYAERYNLQQIPTNNVPWWDNQISSGHSIILDSLSQLPPEAKIERAMLEEQHVQSIMVIPLIIEKKAWGYIGVDIIDESRIWSNEDVQWLSSLANVINICIGLRKAKDTADEKQLFLHNMLHYMPMGYIQLSVLRDENNDLNDYRITDANDICERAFDIPREKLIGLLATNIYPDPTEKLKMLAKILNENTYTELDEYIQKTDSYSHWIIYTTDPNTVICLFIDTTEKTKADKALDRNKEVLKELFANIPVGIEMYDEDGYLFDANDKDMELFGIKDKNQVIGINLFDNPNIPSNIKRRIPKEKLIDFSQDYKFNALGDYYLSEKQEKIRLYTKICKWYNKEGLFCGYIFINIDNTERVNNLNRICDFEEFFLLISNYAKIGYYKMNLISKNGYAVQQWYKNMGEEENTPLSEIIGVYNNVHPNDRPRIMAFFNKVLDGSEKNFQDELRIRRPNAIDAWNWISVNILVSKYDPANNEIEVTGINYDITELKETQNELIAARDKAETMDRLKSAFLANMSHEIRTPLNAIVGFSGLLVESDNIEERRVFIKIIQENNELLLQLISDILDLSKIEAGTFDFVNNILDINELCEDVVRSHSLKVPEDVKLVFADHPPTCYLNSDRNRLQQVLSNFVNNAIKFTTSGSIRLGYTKEDDFLRFYVEDTGIGLSEEQSVRIFDRFVKLNSFIHGTGLGLAICKSIVQQLGGDIGVDSKLGVGSRFWFTHPYYEINEEEKAKEITFQSFNSLIVPDKDHKPYILIAEDIESNYMLISALLKKDYKLEWVRNGEEAVEKCQNTSPDLILMDIQMPVMNGLEATEKIRKFNLIVPILAVTAFAFEEDKEKALKAGCNGFITKPIIGSVLRKEIKEILKYNQ